jgi:hypothetical protein
MKFLAYNSCLVSFKTALLLQRLIWKNTVLLAYSIHIRSYDTSLNFICLKTGISNNTDGVSVDEAVTIYGLMDPPFQNWQDHAIFSPAICTENPWEKVLAHG